MREILFRGKRADNREWVEGSLLIKYDLDACCVSAYYIVETYDFAISGYDDTRFIDVKPVKVLYETLGQYTGLTDKNGKEIFEGDIVKHYNNSDDGFDIGALYWNETLLQWKRTSIGNFHHSSFTYVMNRFCEYEVIGNIHDNPELLKGGKQG